MFYKWVVEGVLFYAAVCWRGSMKEKDTGPGQAGEKGGWTRWGL